MPGFRLLAARIGCVTVREGSAGVRSWIAIDQFVDGFCHGEAAMSRAAIGFFVGVCLCIAVNLLFVMPSAPLASQERRIAMAWAVDFAGYPVEWLLFKVRPHLGPRLSVVWPYLDGVGIVGSASFFWCTVGAFIGHSLTRHGNATNGDEQETPEG
jgi:hypothetical protein